MGLNEQPSLPQQPSLPAEAGGKEKSRRSKRSIPNGSLPKDARTESVAQGSRTGILIVSYRARFLDEDNFAGGGKYVVDALKHCGYIADDDASSVKLFFEQRKSTMLDERTEIYLFPI